MVFHGFEDLEEFQFGWRGKGFSVDGVYMIRGRASVKFEAGQSLVHASFFKFLSEALFFPQFNDFLHQSH